MSAIAVQRKEGDKAVKPAIALVPESQAEERTETGATAGVPLFLHGGRPSGAPPPTFPKSAPRIQRQVEQQKKAEEELDQGIHGNRDIQRQLRDEEAGGVQTQLTVGASDDVYEREADQVADRVMRLPASAAAQPDEEEQKTAIQPGIVQKRSVTPLYIQRFCPQCEEELQQEPSISKAAPSGQRKANGKPSLAASNKIARTVGCPAGGASLPTHVQSRVAPVVGSDLSHVRVHADSQFQEAAHSIKAKAFTHQNHIYLGRGQSENDVRLMAHEAAHVVQQGGAPSPKSSVIQTKDNEEPGAVADPGMYPETGPANCDQVIVNLGEAAPVEQATTDMQLEPLQAEAQTATSQQPAQAHPGNPQPAAQHVGEAGTAQEMVDPAQQEAAAPGAGEGGLAPLGEEVQGEAAGLETKEEKAAPAADQPGAAEVAGNTSAASMARIGSAPDSILKPHVLPQAELINSESLVAEAALTGLAEARRQQVSAQFLEARAGMVQSIENNIATVQGLVAAKQAEALATATGAIATAHGFALSVIQGAEAQSSRIAETISVGAERASTSVQATVGGIAGRIADVVNTVPLPELPGVAQARRVAVNLVNSAAGSVTSALGRVTGLIRRILATGMRLLHSLLGIFRGMVNRAFARISAVIMQALQTIFRTLNRLLHLVVSTLQRVLNSIVLPLLERLERSVLQAITGQEQQALEEIEINREEHLKALAAALSPEEEGGAAAATTPMSVEEWVVAVQEIGQSALINNRAIIADFTENMFGFLVLLISTLRSTVSRLIQTIASQMTQALMSMVTMVLQFLQRIVQMVASVVAYLNSLLQQIIATLTRVLDIVTSLIQRPIDSLVTFAQGVLTRTGNWVRNLIGRVLGGESPSWAPSPLPAPIPLPVPNPEPVPVPVPAPVPTPTPTPIPTPTPGPSPDLLIILLIALVIIILLLLLYLLYKWLTRPGIPKPAKPPKRPSGKEYDPQTPFNVGYSVPLEKNNIQASAGEKLIFGVEASDKDRFRPIGTAAWTDIDPGTGPYEIEYQVAGDADWLTAGSGTKRHVDPTLESSNVYLFIGGAWNGGAITVDATVKDKAVPATPPDIGTTQDADHKITWTIIGRTGACPTSLNRVAGPGAVWVSAPALYTYEAMPEINPPGRPNYENQTVLESFAYTTALGFTMADLTANWKTAHPTLNTPDKVANYLYGVSNNGTFVFDNQDRMSDQHGGFGTTSPFEPAALSRPTGVGYQKDQTYSCASTAIGSALIERRYTTSRGIEVRKTGP